MHIFLYRSLVVVTVLMAAAAPAAAQRAAGPFAGVLGAAADADAANSLDLRGSLFGAWDDTLSDTSTTAVDQQFLRSGAAAGASGSLTHALNSTRLQWQSDANTSLRVYGTQSDAAAATFSGQTGVTTTLSRRVSLSGSGGFTYSPYYDFAPGLNGSLASEGAFGGGFGVATAAERNIATSAGAGLSFQLSRRDSLAFDGSAARYEFLDQNGSSIDSWSMGARFNHLMTRSLTFYAGFSRAEAMYQAGGAPAKSDNFDIGVDYGDTLAFTLARSTTLAFGFSTSAIRWNNSTNFRVNGTASLSHAFGRSGSAVLSYDRGTDFNVGFRDPILRDTVSAGVNNQIGRRSTWSVQAAYVRGGIGFGSTAGHYNSVNGGAGLSVAVTRRIGLFTDYSIYRYEVPGGTTVFTSLPRFSRQSVTAGLTLWVPLISQKRTTK